MKGEPMRAIDDLPPNHHGDYRQFSGPFGYVAGATMILGRGADARLATDRADVTAGDTVLDIGCGPGTAARAAAARGATVIGVDPSAPMLRWARVLSRLRPTRGAIEWRTGAAESLPVDDGAASVCWSIATVHHWPDLDGGIGEVVRVLRPGGRFLAIEKRTLPGASGNASHGWTPGQAERFADLLGGHGFVDVAVGDHDLGRRRVVVVSAANPSTSA